MAVITGLRVLERITVVVGLGVGAMTVMIGVQMQIPFA